MLSGVGKAGEEPLFLTTRWSLVANAAKEADSSLEALCRQYWQPVYAVARRSGNDIEASKDLTQGFFAKLLEKGWLEAADEEKGRFRTFLITALKRYLINEWHSERAAKRGGFAEVVSLDVEMVERMDAGLRSQSLSPDELFDRKWALALLDAALVRLEGETGDDFLILRDCLTAGRGEIDYQQLATTLKISEGAARVAVHRLRKRYRAMIREEVTHTVAREDEVDEEIKKLFEALV